MSTRSEPKSSLSTGDCRRLALLAHHDQCQAVAADLADRLAESERLATYFAHLHPGTRTQQWAASLSAQLADASSRILPALPDRA